MAAMNPRTGSVFKRNGKWGVRVTYTDPITRKRRDLRRTCLEASLPNTKTAADTELKSRLVREVEIILGAGEYRPETTHALLLHFERAYVHPPEFHDGRTVSGYRSEAELRSYLKTLRRILPNKPIADYTYEDCRQAKLALARDRIVTVKRARAKMKPGRPKAGTPKPEVKKVQTERPRSIANVNRILAAWRQCLSLAESQGWIVRNPFPKKGDPRPKIILAKQERQRERILTPAEEKSLLEWCSGPRAHLRLVVLALVDTGMREGELKTRRRRDLDFDAREIRIFAKPSVSTDWTTKTEEGRVVPMSDRLHAELVARGVDQLADDALAFGYTTSVKTAWHTARRLAGLEGLRIHDLRHTAATRLIGGGMELAEVARILGHTDIRTTYRYVNLHAGTVAKARAILDGKPADTGTSAVN